MDFNNINIGTSIMKREAKSIERVTELLRRDGWQETGSLGERVKYFESSGINITVIDGPMGTLILPSGPIRGRVFGDSGLMANNSSVIGAGQDSGTEKDVQEEQASRRVDQIT